MYIKRKILEKECKFWGTSGEAIRTHLYGARVSLIPPLKKQRRAYRLVPWDYPPGQQCTAAGPTARPAADQHNCGQGPRTYHQSGKHPPPLPFRPNPPCMLEKRLEKTLLDGVPRRRAWKITRIAIEGISCSCSSSTLSGKRTGSWKRNHRAEGTRLGRCRRFRCRGNTHAHRHKNGKWWRWFSKGHSMKPNCSIQIRLFSFCSSILWLSRHEGSNKLSFLNLAK